ncbi:MAG: class III extradiol ring-cleavage dioxygenase [Polyangiales bacterium]
MARAPVLFLDHGSPMEAFARNDYTETLGRVGETLASTTAVVVVSAHFESRGPIRVTSHPSPPTIHDFGGFPRALYEVSYGCPGSPALAERIVERLCAHGLDAALDPTRGLDHGVWVPLLHLFPGATHPVLQVSLPVPRTTRLVEELGRALAPLRDDGVVLVGSGGIVHNIPLFLSGRAAAAMPRLVAFDRAIRRLVEAGDAKGLHEYASLPDAALSVPTDEHLDPLFFAFGASSGRPGRYLRDAKPEGLALNVLRWDD